MKKILLLLIAVIASIQYCRQECYSCYSDGDCYSCYSGDYLYKYHCYSCSSNCQTCSSSYSRCTSCYSSYYLSSYSCYNCPNQCSTCSSSTVCTSCNQGYYLNGNNCLSCQSPCSTCVTTNTNCKGCITGYYLAGNTCFLCQKPCTACSTSATYCTACFDSSNQRTPTCDCYSPAKYLDSTSQTCLSCVSPCLNCSSLTQCDSCVSTAYLLQGSICTPCTKPCKQCSGSLTQCLSCIDSRQTIPSCNCNSGYLIDTTTKMCNICTYPCLTCQTTLTYCLSCATTYTYDSVNHICQCSLNQFEYSGTTKTCKNCVSPCDTCFSSSSHCLSCLPGLHRHFVSNKCLCDDGYYENGGICTPCVLPCIQCTSLTTCSCTQGNYLDTSSVCQSCLAPCLNCITNASNCTSCRDTYYFDGLKCLPCNIPCQNCIDDKKCLSCQAVDQYLDDNSCKCLDGKYIDTLYICHTCAYPCSKCIDNANKCLDCVSIFQLSGNQCICPNGFYQQLSNNPQDCQPCTEPCETCLGTSNHCVTCSDPNQIVNILYECLCKDGYYDVGHTCNQCQAPCSKCVINDTSCTECISLDRQVKDYQCVCLDGYGESGNGCSPCIYPCEKCSISITTCTSCIDTGQYTLFNDQCICGQHFYQLDNQCHQCSPQCNTCIKKQDNCLSCSDINHIFWQNDCFCSPGYYTGLSMECIECSSPCSTCIINTDYCTSCVSELYNLIENNCECIDGYYLDESNCQQCKSICTKCKTLDLCQECVQGYYIDNNQCLKCHITCETCISESQNCILCSDGYVMNDNGKFTECHQNCKTCVNLFDYCTSCRAHYDLINNICTCQISYYEDQHECVKCPYPCIECNESKICIKCDELPQLYQNNDKCQCNDGYFWKESSCDICQETCQTCITNNFNCLSCDKSLNRTLNGNICQCSVDYFQDENNKCISCLSDQAKAQKICSYSNCQDNVWTYGEECDDGNNVIRDGCSNCKIDQDYTCINEILKPSLCIKCSSNCKECRINYLNTECLKCDTGYYLDSHLCIKCSNQCLNCSQFPSNCEGCRFIKNKETEFCEMCESKPGYYSDFINNKCTTICGDTFKSSNEECDDGNKLDGDGCDKQCRKEPNFICKNGICIFPGYPTPSLQISGKPNLYNNLRQLLLSYDKKLNVTKDLNITSQMSFFIIHEDKKQQIYYPYTVTQFVETDENNFKNLTAEINITLNQSSSNEIVLIEFLNYQNIISYQGYSQIEKQVNVTLTQFILIQQETKTKVDQVTSSGQYVIYSAGAMFGGAVFFGGMDIFYSLLDTISMLSYFKYVNIQLPFNLLSYFDLFGFVQLSFIGKYFNVKEYFDPYVDYSQLKSLPQKIADDQFISLFIINGISIVTIWLTSMGTFCFAIILKKILDNTKPRFDLDNLEDDIFIKFRVKYLSLRIFIGKFCKIVVTELFFSGFLRIQIQTAYEFLFSLFLQISALQLNSQCLIIRLSSYLALFSLSLYIFQIYILIRISNKAKFILLNQQLIRKYGSVFEGVNKDYYSKYYNVVLLIKKLLFMSILLFLQSGPIYQIIMLAFISLIQNILLISFKPFDSPLELYKQVICEFNTFLTFILLMIIAIDDEIQYLSNVARDNIGWVCIFLISLILLIQLLLDGYSQWTLILRKKSILKRIFQKVKKCIKPDPIKYPQPLVLEQ